MDKENLIEQAKSLAAAMFDPLGNGESDNMVMSNQDAQNAAEIIYGLVALLEDDNPPWTAKDFATAVPFREIVKMHLAEQQTEREQDAKRNVVGLAEQVAQEPVALLEVFSGWSDIADVEILYHAAKKLPDGEYKLYSSPVQQAEQEPDYFGLTHDHTWLSIDKKQYDKLKPEGRMACYAAPVRTKDLTDDEAQKLWHDTSSIVPMWAHHLHFARAVIAADREKNK